MLEKKKGGLRDPYLNRIARSDQFFLTLSRYWEFSTEGDGITLPGRRIAWSCKLIPYPYQAFWFQSCHRRVSNWFRSIWDWLLVSASSWCPAHSGTAGQTFLFNSWSFSFTLLLQTGWLRARDCLGESWELSLTKELFPVQFQRYLHKKISSCKFNAGWRGFYYPEIKFT